MGQVVHTLPEGESVSGVTSLAGEIYVLRDKECDQVEVYDIIQRERHGHKDGTAKPRRRRRRGEYRRHENGGAVVADPLPAD